jgi:hypothetical protein
MRECITSFVEEAFSAKRLYASRKGWRSFGPLPNECDGATALHNVYRFHRLGVGFSRVGMLVVDLKDALQNQLVFQGVSTSTISSRPQKNIRRLRRGINEMFEKYPPQP